MKLHICVLSILNNTNCCNQHWQSLPQYSPVWTICIQHSDYHHSGPLDHKMQETASHFSARQKISFQVEAIITQKGSRRMAIPFT